MFKLYIIIDMIFRINIFSNIGGFGRAYVHQLSSANSFG